MPARPITRQHLDLFVRTVAPVAGGWLRAVYWYGSYVAGDAVYGSDVDFAVVVRPVTPPAVCVAVRTAGLRLSAVFPTLVDVLVCREEELLRMGAPWLVGRSVLLAGDDLRAAVPHPPTAEYVQRVITHAWEVATRPRVSVLPPPADGSPDPFHGLINRWLKGPGGVLLPSTQGLVSAGLRMAAGLVAVRTGRDAGADRTELLARADEAIGRALSGGAVELIEVCRTRGEYRLLREPEEVARVVRLCERVATWSDDFLRSVRQVM